MKEMNGNLLFLAGKTRLLYINKVYGHHAYPISKVVYRCTVACPRPFLFQVDKDGMWVF